jgi:hypothetical protein
MELDVPPASHAVANDVFDDIAVFGSAVAVSGATASGSPVGTWGPDGAASVVADGTWGPDSAASAVAGGGRSPAPLPADACCWEPDSPVGATLGAEGEEALISRGWVNTRQYDD